MRDGFAYHTPYTLTPDYHRPGWTTFLRHPIAYLVQVWFVGSTTTLNSEEIGPASRT